MGNRQSVLLGELLGGDNRTAVRITVKIANNEYGPFYYTSDMPQYTDTDKQHFCIDAVGRTITENQVTPAITQVWQDVASVTRGASRYISVLERIDGGAVPYFLRVPAPSPTLLETLVELAPPDDGLSYHFAQISNNAKKYGPYRTAVLRFARQIPRHAAVAFASEEERERANRSLQADYEQIARTQHRLNFEDAWNRTPATKKRPPKTSITKAA